MKKISFLLAAISIIAFAIYSCKKNNEVTPLAKIVRADVIKGQQVQYNQITMQELHKKVLILDNASKQNQNSRMAGGSPDSLTVSDDNALIEMEAALNYSFDDTTDTGDLEKTELSQIVSYNVDSLGDTVILGSEILRSYKIIKTRVAAELNTKPDRVVDFIDFLKGKLLNNKNVEFVISVITKNRVTCVNPIRKMCSFDPRESWVWNRQLSLGNSTGSCGNEKLTFCPIRSNATLELQESINNCPTYNFTECGAEYTTYWVNIGASAVQVPVQKAPNTNKYFAKSSFKNPNDPSTVTYLDNINDYILYVSINGGDPVVRPIDCIPASQLNEYQRTMKVLATTTAPTTNCGVYNRCRLKVVVWPGNNGKPATKVGKTGETIQWHEMQTYKIERLCIPQIIR